MVPQLTASGMVFFFNIVFLLDLDLTLLDCCIYLYYSYFDAHDVSKIWSDGSGQ
jgi:hypothetical protein